MSRQTPFSEFLAAAIPPVIVLGKRPPVHNDWNGTFKVLMAQCWGQLPSHRPPVREVRQTLESINHDRYAFVLLLLRACSCACYVLINLRRVRLAFSFSSSFLFNLYFCSNDRPASVRSSVSTVTTAASHDVELSERANYPPRGEVTLVFTDVENSATVRLSLSCFDSKQKKLRNRKKGKKKVVRRKKKKNHARPSPLKRFARTYRKAPACMCSS